MKRTTRSGFLGALLAASLAAPPAAAQFSEAAGEVLAMINEFRLSGATCSGTGTSWGPSDALIPSAPMFEAAHRWSRQMTRMDELKHGRFGNRIRKACPNPGVLAENIAGNPTARGAVESWMASPHGHCEAIMNPDHRFAGIGMAQGGRYGAYWTVKFAQNC